MSAQPVVCVVKGCGCELSAPEGYDGVTNWQIAGECDTQGELDQAIDTAFDGFKVITYTDLDDGRYRIWIGDPPVRPVQGSLL